MRTLVTGHLGFVGRHLTAELDRRGVEWVGCDLKLGHNVETSILPSNAEVERVYHLAAQTDAYCPDAARDARTNILGTLRVLRRYGSKVVYASTSMINYPSTPYAISKQAAENYVRLEGGAVVRFCNLYGEGGHSVIDRFREEPVCTIYGSGDQRRSFAHITEAVTALLSVEPGAVEVLRGHDLTVNEIAMATGKPVQRVPGRKYDLMDAIQLPA